MTPLSLTRVWHQRLVALALGALLGLQGIGLWHGIAHALPGAQQTAGTAASSAAHFAAHGAKGHWGQSGHWGHSAGDLACELLDHLAQATPLATAAMVVAPPTLLAAAPVVAAPTGRAADTPSAFLARAPPRG
ncbi:hypothetical protein [Ideonella alba]|uniref:DUF2946 domain-containing protein n=1 Tax=Ideonella alba TaxID=2824118 RepID=A0A940YHY9_9BURK|nr:hypothetical protein [Ideonella alba]MBQ0930239.1 hypothetical protein [Ideonella alba]